MKEKKEMTQPEREDEIGKWKEKKKWNGIKIIK